jgi:ABC-2 type transport system ATP-binding protein
MTSTRDEVTLRVAGVEKSFGRTRALDGVDFDASAGVTGLLGPNGAGKTTLLRIVATTIAPDSGSVSYRGVAPTSGEDHRDIRRSLGYLPQEPGFHNGFTAFEFVDYIATLKEMTDRTERHAEVNRVLDQVGLSDRSASKVKALSGGMRRRLALAQALLERPQLIVLDEPTAGLDPEQRLRFRELVSSVATEATVLLSTHLTEDISALCSALVVIDHGQVIFTGTPEGFVDRARGRVWISDEPDSRAELSWRAGDGRFRHIGDPPTGAEFIAPTLEDAYLVEVGTETPKVTT